MAFVSPKMGLRVWNQLSDLYDHDQMADNWAKVDYHDHTPGRGVPIPTEGIADGAITAAKISGTLGTGQIADNAITSAKILDGTITDSDLASPNNNIYKQIIPSLDLATTGTLLASGSTYLLAETLATPSQPSGNNAGGSAFYLDPADYTVGSKTNKYRLRVSLLTNAVAPTSTFTAGLYPVTACTGGAGVNSITLGTVTPGSTCAFVAPGANALVTPVSSGDFTTPVAGYYVVAVAVSVASMAASSSVTMRAILQHRQV